MNRSRIINEKDFPEERTIQRFEYTFETFWKYAREYLREKEGIPCNSPKGCFRELFSTGSLIVDEEEANRH